MKALLLLALLASTATAQTKPQPKPQPKPATSVYICTGSASHAYHRATDCPGLDNCTRAIKPITAVQAQQLKRHPCGICK